MTYRFFTLALLPVICSAALSGCAHRDIHRSSSSAPLAKVIETTKDSTMTTRKAPLTLPASVAILFAPPEQRGGTYVPATTLRQAAEKLKHQLVANPKYIKSVTVVAGNDIKEKISLEQIRALYGTDIAILLSYQQDQRSSQSGAAGFMDITIIGAFTIPGVETMTTSIVDGKVIHIPSSAILFMASGTDERSVHSTTYTESSTAMEESINGVHAATANFGTALTAALSKFDNYDFSQAVSISVLTTGSAADTAKDKPANDYWKKVDSYKSTGGGAFGLLPQLMALALCGVVWRIK